MATFTGSDKAIAFLFDMVANMADDYDSTSTYAYGDYAIYNGTLYKCAYTISTPEDFTPAHWQAVLIMDEITSGGGGGGTTVIANPAGAATDTLNKLQVASTIYSIPSGGGGIDYSETEQDTGLKWIDGKAIYQKTIKYNAPNTSGNVNIPHNISNMETVVSINAIMNHSEVVPYGENMPSKDVSMGRVSVNATNIFVGISGSWGGYIFVVTLRYTKTV